MGTPCRHRHHAGLFQRKDLPLPGDGSCKRGEAAPDEDEFLNVVRLPLSEAIGAAERGEIADSKTVCALLLANARMGKEA